MPTRKRFELLDCPKFAYPSLRELDVSATAANLVERLAGKTFLNYGQIWPLIQNIVEGSIDHAGIAARLRTHAEEWKNKNLEEVAAFLTRAFGKSGRWYRAGQKPFEVLPGAYFKPSIRGTWFSEGKAYSVGINARKGQRLWPEHIKFWGRGIYEFHSIDDPNNPLPMIIDLSAPSSTGERELRTFVLTENEMMSLEEFESILKRFFDALEMAGVTTIPEEIGAVADLFRRKP